jgi:translocator protein
MLALHIIGARWIYSYVPYEEWFDAIVGSGPGEWFGWRRNHYDRLVHFAFGVLLTYPLTEGAARFAKMPQRAAMLFAWLAVAGISAIYEVAEWALAVIAAPEMAERYNGQQGDLWDAQKDMGLAIAGSTVALAAAWGCSGRHSARETEIMTDDAAHHRAKPLRWLMLIPFLILTGAAAAFGQQFAPGQWYETLQTPSFAPPNWIFGVVWTPLYVMIALAGWLLWERGKRSRAMTLWFVQLALNAAWSWIFFGLHQIGGALAEIVILWLAIGATILLSRQVSKAAAWLLTPYWAWVAFAIVLNAAYWRLNN